MLAKDKRGRKHYISIGLQGPVLASVDLVG